MKKTVIQCVTALLCVIAVAVTSVISVGKISTAKVDAAKAAAANSSASGDASTDPSADPSVDPAAPADPSADPSATDPSATDPSNPASPAATDPASPATPSATKPGSSSTASKVPSTAADIAAYYNAAVNKAVNSKAGFSKKRTTTLSNLNGGALLKIKLVVDTVNDFLGVGTQNKSYAKGKIGEISKASLTAKDISSPTCKQSGSNYVITMTLKNGTSKASKAGKSDSTALARTGLYSGVGDKKAYDYKNAGNLYDGINNADKASVEAITENNKNIKITATVNSKTGNLVSLHVSYDWDVSLTNVKYSVATISTATGDAKTSVDFTNFVF
ncbi:unknown [Ruminococcus sp. CAG:563]|nr:unknown [Ruminococcus sp. CAG:563]